MDFDVLSTTQDYLRLREKFTARVVGLRLLAIRHEREKERERERE